MVVPKDEVGTWKTKLIEQNTYVLQHLNVYRNDFQYKACDNPYKGVIFAGTTVKQKPIPEIPPSGFQFKDFNDIINGKFRVDLLVGKSYIVLSTFTYGISIFLNTQINIITTKNA